MILVSKVHPQQQLNTTEIRGAVVKVWGVNNLSTAYTECHGVCVAGAPSLLLLLDMTSIDKPTPIKSGSPVIIVIKEVLSFCRINTYHTCNPAPHKDTAALANNEISPDDRSYFSGGTVEGVS